MKNTLRTVAAIIAGLFTCVVLLIGVELFSAVVHPLPDDFAGTQAEMCEHVARYPQWVLAVVVPAWAAIALMSVWLARRIGNIFSAAIVGLLLFIALVSNLAMLPYPMWFKIANVIAIPAAIFAGVRWSRAKGVAKQAIIGQV